MPAPKGHKKWGGKSEGTKNKKTIEWESIGQYLIGDGANRAMEILQQENDAKFMFHFMQLLEYFKPKLQRTELTGENGEDIKVKTVIKFSDGSSRE